MNIVATINQFVLPVVLFAIYFCGACILFYSPDSAPTSHAESELSSDFYTSVSDAFDDIFDTTSQSNPQPEKTFTSSEETPLNTLMTTTTKVIQSLTKREARKLCKPLAVKQTNTTNGTKTELTLALMKGAFLKKLKSHPDEVCSAIQKHLPEKMSDKEALNQVS